MLLWHTLATYFRRKYGVRVQKIPLDAGATCPNRDGTLSARGCIFCNDSGSGSGMGLRGLDLRAQWDAWYTKYTTTDSDRLFMAYLQSFSNTYGPASRLAHLLEQVAALPGCRGIAVGTRPDCLDGEKLALLAGCGLDEVWLELGLQTCRDDTLRRINRGHTARQAEEAVRAALDAGLLVCGHLMAGLPGEDENDFLDGVDWAVSLGMQGLKLPNVYVPQGTELARQWRAGDYRPLARDEYVDMLCAALPRIPSTVVMQRIQADPAPGELLAPAWALEKRGIITDLRRAKGLTQLELAEQLNYSDTAVSKWERAESMPDISGLVEIADLFDVPLDYLVRAEHPKKDIQPSEDANEMSFLYRKGYISGISILLVWLIAVLVYVLISFFAKDAHSQWLSFVYAIPDSAIVWLVFNRIWLTPRQNIFIH